LAIILSHNLGHLHEKMVIRTVTPKRRECRRSPELNNADGTSPNDYIRAEEDRILNTKTEYGRICPKDKTERGIFFESLLKDIISTI